MKLKQTVVTSAKRSYSQMVLSCQHQVTVGWVLWLVTTFWAITGLSTKFWKYMAEFVADEQLQQIIALWVHCPPFWYSQSWFFPIIISQALVPYIFDYLLFVLLIKTKPNKPQINNKLGQLVCLFLAFEYDCSADFQLELGLFTLPFN